MGLVEQGGWKDMEEVRGEKNAIKIYYMEKINFQLKMAKNRWLQVNWSISGSSYFLKNRNLYITPCGFELPTILLQFLEYKDDRYTQLTLRLVFNVLMGKKCHSCYTDSQKEQTLLPLEHLTWLILTFCSGKHHYIFSKLSYSQ